MLLTCLRYWVADMHVDGLRFDLASVFGRDRRGNLLFEPIGYANGLGIYAAIGILLAYEHTLVRPDDLSRVNRAFFQVNAVISLGLFVVVIVQLAAAAGIPPGVK